MSVIIILISISVIIALTFLFAFLWSLKSGQYEDTYSPSVRILFDNTTGRSKKIKKGRSEIKAKSND